MFGLGCTVLKLESAKECRHREPTKMNNFTEEAQVPSHQIATNDQKCQFGSTAVTINVLVGQIQVHLCGNLFIP